MNFVRRRASYAMNPGLVSHTNNVFRGISKGREKALYHWFDDIWTAMGLTAKRLETLFDQTEAVDGHYISELLEQQRLLYTDITELFLLDAGHKVVTSTCSEFIGATKNSEYISRLSKDSYMYGPYMDEDSLRVGKGNSKFFDEVTLMFIRPLNCKQRNLYLCGRVPNDVMSDVLQDEDSHLYKDSGDNYLFMVENRRSIPTGTAISRSRFEDNAFTLGDNLKDGVKTNGYGTVQVKEHTEFEIVFTDPATKELHTGVKETIRKGSNLESWPGYPDYRHILVGGQGILIHPPHSDETWGLLCEGDIEEIFKYRNLNIKFFLSLGVLYAVPIILFGILENSFPQFIILLNVLQWAFLSIITLFLINLLALKPLKNTIGLLEEIAEGEGDLTKRVQVKSRDQMGELSRWFNKFVNNQMHIARRIKNATKISKHSVEELGQLMYEVNESTGTIDSSLKEMLNTFEGYTYGLEGMQSDFSKINTTMEDINSTMETATGEMNSINKNALESRTVSLNAYKMMKEIVAEVNEATKSIHQLEEFSNQISGVIDIISSISRQTNLLSLNASIEAARAGEYGNGFAIVAGEIRKLAGMTLDSSKKINDQIQNIQDEIKHNARNIRHIGDKVKLGSDSVNQTIDSFSVIQKDIENITSSFGTISDQLSDNTTLIENILETQNTFIKDFEEASNSTKVNCNSMIKTLEVNNRNMQQVKDTLEYTTMNMYTMVNEFKIE